MSSISSIGNSYNSYIASGRRINSAADDAAGMTISQEYNKQISAKNQNAENASQTKDALNIADGAYAGVTDYLQSIKQLSVKAANGTTTVAEKQAIQSQIDQYLDGINQLANGTEYNTKKLINSDSAIFAATNPDGTGFDVEVKDSTVKALGLEGYSVMGGDIKLDDVDAAIAKVSENRSNVGASVNALDYSAAYSELSAQELSSADSNLADLDIAKAVSDQKKEELLEEYRTMMFSKQKEDEENLNAKLFKGI